VGLNWGSELQYSVQYNYGVGRGHLKPSKIGHSSRDRLEAIEFKASGSVGPM